MMHKGWFYLVLAISAEVIALTSLKASSGFTRPGPAIIVVIGYGISFYFLAQTLQYISIGITYAVWSGVGIVLITLIGIGIFRQKLDVAAYLGIALIVTGVIVISLFSNTTTRN